MRFQTLTKPTFLPRKMKERSEKRVWTTWFHEACWKIAEIPARIKISKESQKNVFQTGIQISEIYKFCDCERKFLLNFVIVSENLELFGHNWECLRAENAQIKFWNLINPVWLWRFFLEKNIKIAFCRI